MIRIAITAAAYEAIASTLPLGSEAEQCRSGLSAAPLDRA
jgi:hypothetical protein